MLHPVCSRNLLPLFAGSLLALSFSATNTLDAATNALQARADATPGRALSPSKVNRYAGDVYIDARTGKTSGLTNFSQCASASVVIKNKQPFLYTYAFDSKVSLIPEPGLDGLAAIFGTTLDLLKLPDKSAGAGGGPPDPNKLVPLSDGQCPGAKVQADLLTQRVETFLKSINNLISESSKTKKAFGAHWGVLQDATSTESAMERAASELLSLEDTAADFLIANRRLMVQLDEISGLAAALLVLTQSPPCSTYFLSERNQAALFRDSASAYTERLAALAKEAKAMLDAIAFSKKVLLDSDRYEHLVKPAFGPFDDPTKISWTLTASEIGGKTVKTFDGSLSFGAPRFHLAAGLAFSPLNTVEYGRVASPLNSTDTAVRVGRIRTSNFRTSPLAAVHARLNPCAASTIPVYFSLGITAKADNKGTVPEYLIGISTAFLGNRLFFTGGAYIGQVQSLQGGLTEGAQVPEKLSELPIAKGYTSRIGFGVTYRFR
jgi:hypothetical protein